MDNQYDLSPRARNGDSGTDSAAERAARPIPGTPGAARMARRDDVDDGWNEYQDEPGYAEENRSDDHREAPGENQRRRPHVGRVAITPTRVILAIAIVGSVLFGLYSLTVRDATQIPLLATGAAVLGLVFSALTVSGVISTYRAGSDERAMRATFLAVGSGVASIIALGCFAGAILLALVWTTGRR